MSFFNISDISSQIERDDVSVKRQYSCETCGLHANCKSPKLGVSGEGAKKILVVLDAVTHIEDQSGQARRGSHYAYLKSAFSKHGIDLAKDCWTVNAVRCYQKEDKYGVKTMDACSRLLNQDIARLKPSVVVTTSDTAWDVLHYTTMRGRAASASYFDWCGEIIPDQRLKVWIAPIYETSRLKEEDNTQTDKKYPYNKYELTYHQSIDQFIGKVGVPVPSYDIDSPIRTTTSKKEAIEWLGVVLSWKKFAWDIETTGLRPYRDDQKIKSVSFSNGVVSYAMPVWYDKDFLDAFVKVLQSPAVKIAHNKAFERLWALVQLKTDVNKLNHDPMLAWHVWHCKKPTSLKYISYALFGILGYDSEMDEFLKPDKDEEKKWGANAINHIDKAPLGKLLKYNAIDSLITYWENDIILSRLDPEHMMPGYKLLCSGEEALTEMTHNGFRIDVDEMNRIKPIIQEKVDSAYKRIMDDPLILRQWHGTKFNPSSDADVRTLLYNVLKFEVLETTDNGLPSTDVEALEAYRDDCSIITPMIEYRRWYKLANTFIKQLERETMYGVVHSTYSLNNIATYRSGCQSVNVQNQPARDKEVVEYLRSLFYPLKGHKLLSLDYKSLEVMGSAAITRDRSLITYVTDPTTDMHRRFATVLFLLLPEQITKGLRNLAKLNLFASFYGSYYVLMAKNMWKSINSPRATKMLGFDIKSHLASKGITTYAQWEEHVQGAEHWLWNEEFVDYKKYKQNAYKDFQENGEVYYPTGFTYKGVSSRNQVGNGATQGSSFHMNLWAFTNLNREMKKRGMNSKLLAEIHDSIIVSCDPMEEEILLKMIYDYHVVKVREVYDWFNVPLILELSAGGVDEPWSKVKEIGELKY